MNNKIINKLICLEVECNDRIKEYKRSIKAERKLLKAILLLEEKVKS